MDKHILAFITFKSAMAFTIYLLLILYEFN